MKKAISIPATFFTLSFRFSILLPFLYAGNSNAQNWLTAGNSGITPSNFIGTINNADLIFRANNTERGRILSAAGVWRFGNATNFAKIDSTGKLSFGGTGAYQVAGNKYAFQYTNDPDYGLFFNSTNVRYEFRNGSAVPIFYVDANNGNSVFNGTLKIGAYTLPATDGLNGQVLKTNGAGVLSWSADNNSGGGGANTALSNLTTTAINQSLLPAANNTIDLGSSGKTWRDIYLGSGLYLKGNLVLHSPGISNTAVGAHSLSDNTGGAFNTAIGDMALRSNTTGYGNTASGDAALSENKSGSSNTANGILALSNNETGSFNTGIGENALHFNTTGYSNTAIGASSLFSNTTITNLVAIGDSALYSNGTGVVNSYDATNNTAIGSKSLYANTTGYSNTGTGFKVLYANTTGYSNTANGIGALYSNTTGYRNLAIGTSTLYSNTTGFYNSAVGFYSLFSNTTGHSNTASGVASLFSNTTVSNLVAIGDSALYNNGNGATLSYEATGNTAVGSKSLYSNTTGGYNTATGYGSMYSNTTGLYNTANGSHALYSSTSGVYNTANGYYSLNANTTGYNNTANGVNALYNNTDGYGNTASGVNALYSNTTGDANVAVGLQADVTTSNLSYATVIGAGAVVDASYKVRIGNTDITSIGGQVSWTTFSDGRYKKNIKENVPGLSFINSLRPITYTVDMKGLNEYYNKGRKQVSENKDENTNAEKAKAADRSSKIVYDGFIAQEVEEAAKKLNFEFSGVDKPQSKDAVYGLRYDNFVVPLVKAVQELSKINNDKATEIDELKKQNNAQQEQIDELKAMMQLLQQNFEKCNPCSQQPGISNQQSTFDISAAFLEQNIPNPFNHTTTINYTLPATYTSAKIVITNEAGKVLKEINVSGSGKGSLQINASMFAAGVYNYSLYINSRLIETKKMIK
ncbi:MAG: tail fiber domain-containing protein [Panacibacter sp.]